MVRTDGVEGYIGGDCARRHFQADSAFLGAAARARRDVRIQSLVARLEALDADREVLRLRITDVFERQHELRKAVSNVRDVLPFPVLERFHDMVKSGDRSVRLEFRHVENDENRSGKEMEAIRWRPDQVATVLAPAPIEVALLNDIGDRLRIAVQACNHAETSTDRTEKELRALAESIEAIDRCESDLEESATALSAFVNLQNLRWLCWTCRKDVDQIKTAQGAMRLTGMRNERVLLLVLQ